MHKQGSFATIVLHYRIQHGMMKMLSQLSTGLDGVTEADLNNDLTRLKQLNAESDALNLEATNKERFKHDQPPKPYMTKSDERYGSIAIFDGADILKMMWEAEV